LVLVYPLGLAQNPSEPGIPEGAKQRAQLVVING